eukprot:13997808-Alexandrium_andersonii.AAC.1
MRSSTPGFAPAALATSPHDPGLLRMHLAKVPRSVLVDRSPPLPPTGAREVVLGEWFARKASGRKSME